MHEEDFTEDTGRPSKTKKKEAMHELRDLGEELVELSVGQLKKINLSENYGSWRSPPASDVPRQADAGRR